MGATNIYINGPTVITIKKDNNLFGAILLFVGGVYIGVTYKQWWPIVSELLYNVRAKFDSGLDGVLINNVPKNDASKSTTIKTSGEGKSDQSRVDASQTSATFTTKKESGDEPLVEENESPSEDVLQTEPIPSSESSSSQTVQDSNHGKSDDGLNNKNIWKQLPLPCCFKGLSREEAAKAIDELYAATIGKYISCSSRNYFYYIFSSTSLPNGYCPPSDSWISCNKGAAFLKALIKRLYNEKNGRILRGTWPNVERIFLVNGEKPHTGLGKNTNKASVQCQREVNSIVAGVLSKAKSR